MLEEVRPDGVVVTTPHSLHAAPAIAALRRGIHVLDEKPMATSLEDCQAMVRAADEHAALLMCLPFDHTPAFLTALEFLNEETLGKFTGAEAVLLIPGPPRDNWYYDRSIAPGDAMRIGWQGFKDCYRVTPREQKPGESMIDHFVTCIHTRREPHCSGHLQLHVHEILFKGYRAAETGQTQELETTFPLWHEVPPGVYNTRDGWV